MSAAPSPTTSQRVSHSGSHLVVWRTADRISAFLVHVYVTTRLISEYHRKYTFGESVQVEFRYQEVRGSGERMWCAVHEFCRLLSTAPNYAAIETDLALIPSVSVSRLIDSKKSKKSMTVHWCTTETRRIDFSRQDLDQSTMTEDTCSVCCSLYGLNGAPA